MSWSTLWAVVLASVLVLYFGLAVVVTWGGFFDVKAMFASLKQQHKKSNDDGRNE